MEAREGRDNIVVAVRCRPLNERERGVEAHDCVKVVPERGEVLVTASAGEEPRSFQFDHVYGAKCRQEDVFEQLGQPVLQNAVEGFNGTIFAYGQTGSGKTHSMTGSADSAGIIPRLNRGLFEHIKAHESPSHKFLVVCSYLEIYNEIVRDLLAGAPVESNKTGLQLKEHPVLGVYVKDLRTIVCDSYEKVMQLIEQGSAVRTQGATKMNAHSSRSHSIFSITIHQKKRNASNNEKEDGDEAEAESLFAKMNLVDLAGSERASRTGAKGDRLKEGANINKSLSALGQCINTLSEGAARRGGKKVFVPYRNSKLTRVLQQSLGGNSRCSMLATISPASDSLGETLSTLTYAKRAKTITVHAKRNEEADVMNQLKDEVATLKAKLEAMNDADPTDQVRHSYEAQIHEMNSLMKQTWEDKQQLSERHEQELRSAAAKLEAERARSRREREEARRKQRQLLVDKADPELTLQHMASVVPSERAEQWRDRLDELRTKREAARRLVTVLSVQCTSLDQDSSRWTALAAGVEKGQYPAEYAAFAVQCQLKLEGLSKEARALAAAEAEVAEDLTKLEKSILAEHGAQDALMAAVSETRAAAKSAGVTRPKPAVQLLQRPPVRFMYDLVAQLRSKFGFAAEVEADISQDRVMANSESKVRWLKAIVGYTALCLGETTIRADPVKIARGQEPLHTNYLLQGMLAAAAKAETQAFETAAARLAQGGAPSKVSSPKTRRLSRGDTFDDKLAHRHETLALLAAQVREQNESSLRAAFAEAAPHCALPKFSQALMAALSAASSHCAAAASDNPDVGALAGPVQTALQGLEALTGAQAAPRFGEDVGSRLDALAAGALQVARVAQALPLPDALSLRIRELEAELAASRSEATAAEDASRVSRDNEALRSTIDALEVRLATAQRASQALPEAEARLAQLQAEQELAAESRLALEARLAAAQAESAKQSSRADALQAEAAQHEEQLGDLQQQVAVLLEERDAARAQEEAYFQDISDLEEEAERLKASYVRLTDELNTARDDLADARDAAESWEQTARAVTASAATATPAPAPQDDAHADQLHRTLLALARAAIGRADLDRLRPDQLCAVVEKALEAPLPRSLGQEEEEYEHDFE